MCGIAGEINLKENLKENFKVYENMLAKLKRRGPDSDGVWLENNAAMIHARLAVVDLKNGVQPMFFEHNGEQFILIYNGELYNTLELKSELESLGHQFKTRSDTEVLGRAYIEWKEKALDKLNGIFAFAVWEKNAKKLFCARDRIGVKPFFYAIRNDSFIFASEIKALLEHPKIPAEIDYNGVCELILIGPGRTPGGCAFKNIFELEPGHFGIFYENKFDKYKYWDLKDSTIRHENFTEVCEKVRYLVTNSIERQLVSDVPVGVFLSGGLDSSLISSVAGRYFKAQNQKFTAFSVYYKDNAKYFKSGKFQPESDDQYIEYMKKYLKNMCGDLFTHEPVILDSSDLVGALFEAVEARDLPGMADVDSSLLLFCREIKNHATVALSGECADEIFGGYPWYRDKTIREKNGFPWSQAEEYRKSFLNEDLINFGLSNQKFAENYASKRYAKTVNESDVIFTHEKDEKRMKEMVNLNMKWFMQTLLDRKDRMSMFSGLEVRVPFCDHRIAEYMYNICWNFKDYKNTEKGLLRESARDLLPDEVLWRKKSPYPKTHNPAYLREVSAILEEIINQNNSPVLKIASKASLNNLLKSGSDLISGNTRWYGQLMAVPQTIAYFVQMNYWLEKYNVNIL